MRILLLIVLLAPVAAYTPRLSAQQQSPAAGAADVCPLPPCRPVPPRGIDLADAKKMVAAAAAAAAKEKWNVAFAVVDANGDLVYFERMDGAHDRGVTSALGKARAAALYGENGFVLQEKATAAQGKPIDGGPPMVQHGNVTITAPPQYPWEVLPQAGGLPILKNGKVVAGLGVGGSRPNEADKKTGRYPDDAFGKVGIAAIASSGYSTK